MRKMVESEGNCPLFQVFYVKEGNEQGAEFKTVSEVDFGEVKKRLEQGEAILIVPKALQNLDLNHSPFPDASDSAKKNAAEPWYFTHE